MELLFNCFKNDQKSRIMPAGFGMGCWFKHAWAWLCVSTYIWSCNVTCSQMTSHLNCTLYTILHYNWGLLCLLNTGWILWITRCMFLLMSVQYCLFTYLFINFLNHMGTFTDGVSTKWSIQTNNKLKMQITNTGSSLHMINNYTSSTIWGSKTVMNNAVMEQNNFKK